jgi:hypothetical protein
MKRVGYVLAFVALFALPMLAEPQQQVQRPNAQRGNADAPQPNGVQQRIAELYVSSFITEVELTDDQFLKIGNFVRQYIRRRFDMAQRREAINQQLDLLSSQASPSEEDVAALIDAKTRVDRNTGNAESVFLEEIRSTLTAKQIARFYSFNHAFFDERLPNLIERAREAAAQRGQGPARQNQNPQVQRPNNPNRRGNAIQQNRQGQN